MSKGFIRIMQLVLIAVMAVSFSSCNTGSSSSDSSSSSSGTDTTTTTTTTGEYSTDVEALTVSSKVSVVDAKESSANANINSLNLNIPAIQAAISTGNFSDDSDYNTDETVVYVHEQSSEALNTVNSILCYLDQIRFNKMLNRGDYKAQVDESQCDQQKGGESSSSGEGGGADKSSGNTVSYSYWVANSSRADNSSDQIVKAWVSASKDDPQYIKAKMTITEGASDSNDLGIFRLDFAGYKVDADLNPTSELSMRGFMYTEQDADGKVYLKFNNKGVHEEQGKDFDFEEGVNVSRKSDGSGGSGSALGMEWSQSGPSSVLYDFAFNGDYFYRGVENGEATCLDRNNFNETAWRYGMYDNTGAQVDINSGFPIKYTSGDKTYHGWIGYWGLWMPDEAGVTNGSTVTKEAFSDNDVEQDYTVYQVGGKLEKHARKELTMAEIKNIPLSWWDEATSKEYQVMWNGTNLVKVAERTEATNWMWQPLDSEETVTFSAGTYGFYFYSDSLGGDGQIMFDNWDEITASDGSGQNVVPTVSADSTVIFHSRETVFPGDDGVPADLVCFDNCPDPTKLDQSDYFFTTDWNNPTAVEYTFENGVLMYGDQEVVMDSTSDSNQDGVWSGALFEDTQANLDQLACPWDSSQTCAWQAWDKLDTYYTWSTGPNDWNKLTTLTSNGSYLKFDSPMQVKYTHLSGEYANTVFYLEYQGYGNLEGIPEMCINTDTGEEVDCWSLTQDDYDNGNIRWLRKFVIPNGSVVTGSDGTEYVIKALEVEQSMKKVDEATCTAAGLELSSSTIPDISEWTDPDIGDEPTVDGAPAVIGGVIQITLD